MSKERETPQEALRRNVTGKVEAGEATPIVEVRAPEAGPPPGHVQQPGTVWTPSDPQQQVAPAKARKKQPAKEATVTTLRGPRFGKERESFYATIVVTAVEGVNGVGGVSRWAEVDRYAWWAHDLEGGLAKPAPDGGDNAAAFLVVQHGSPPQPKKHFVDLFCIDHAYVTLAAGEVSGLPEVDRARFLDVRNRVLREKDPEPDAADELDGADCDRIVQVGLFDAVVFE